MARSRSMERFTAKLFILLILLIVLGAFVPLPSASHHPAQFHSKKLDERKFGISEDMFWKDGEPFRIIGGDLHYFRVHPKYWEDRLLRTKALGLNTIQMYVPWNLHEPSQGRFVFDGIADIISFLELCKKMNLLVMMRAGPYICGEWDLGGLPAWLLAEEPAIRLRSSDPAFLDL
ncbi:Beta-galactosidase 17 [Orobanche gracilis]